MSRRYRPQHAQPRRTRGGVLGRIGTIVFGVAMAASVAVGTVAVGHAAGLGGIDSASLDAWKLNLGAPGNPGAYEPFPSTGDLGGTQTGGGQTWTVHTGTYTGNGTTVASGGGTSVATVNAAISNVIVTVTLVQAQPRESGITLNANAAGTNYIRVIYTHQNAGAVRLYKTVGGTTTLLANANQLGTPANSVIGATHYNGRYTVSLNGVQVLTYTLSTGDCTTFCSNTRHGIVSVNDTTTGFDQFTILPYNGP